LSPFQNIDAQNASRAFYEHLNEKPQDSERLVHALVDGFSAVPSSDNAWDPVKNISQGMEHTTNLQLAEQIWSNKLALDSSCVDQDFFDDWLEKLRVEEMLQRMLAS
jgi:hypothetical protein